MRYKYVFFDFDGTISDSKSGVIEAVVYVLGHFGISVDDIESLKCYVGPPLELAFMEYAGLSEKQIDEVVRLYRSYYNAHCLEKNYLFSGIRELFSVLRKSGCKVIVATNKYQTIVEGLIDRFGITELVDFIAGHDEQAGRFTKSDVIKYAIDSVGVTDISEAVMVGDRKYDIAGAKQVGMDSIGVLYGCGEREELENAGATFIVDVPADVAEIVLGE